MTAEEWQKLLDRTFPGGVLVTQIEDVVEDMTDSVTFPSPGLRVLAASEGECDVLCFPATFDKDVRFHIVEMEKYRGGWLVHTPGETPDFFLSGAIDRAHAPELRALWRRSQQYYADVETYARANPDSAAGASK